MGPRIIQKIIQKIKMPKNPTLANFASIFTEFKNKESYIYIWSTL